MKTILISALLLIAGSGMWCKSEAVTYVYNDAGRLVSADYGGSQVITYSYDATGNLLSVTAKNPDNTLKAGVSPAGSGSVTGDGINCPGDCEETFSGSSSIVLTAVPNTDYSLVGWSGNGSGTANPMTLTMDQDRNVLAYFGKTDGSTDNDGLSDTAEMGPSGTEMAYDGDANGVPDYQEGTSASLPTADGSSYATLSVQTGYALENVRAIENPSPDDAPADGNFPYGFFSFNVTGLTAGGCADVELILPLNHGITDYYKYGPEPENSEPHWYLFNYEGTTGAEIIHETDHTRIILHFCDAWTGDDESTQDSMIIDAGGPLVLLDADPDIHVSPWNIQYNAVAAGNSSTATVTVSNLGGGSLVIGPVDGSGSLADPFQITFDDCSNASLANGETCSVTIAFAPSGQGRFSDTFNISSNDDGESPVTIYLSGSCPSQPGAPGDPDISVSPNSLDFGNVTPGASSLKTITVTNTGGSDLVIGTVASSDALNTPFSITGGTCSGQTLSPGGTCSIDVDFSPSEINSYTDSFDIPSNDPDESSVVVTVRGAGSEISDIPTLGQWGVILFALLLASTAFYKLRSWQL